MTASLQAYTMHARVRDVGSSSAQVDLRLREERIQIRIWDLVLVSRFRKETRLSRLLKEFAIVRQGRVNAGIVPGDQVDLRKARDIEPVFGGLYNGLGHVSSTSFRILEQALTAGYI